MEKIKMAFSLFMLCLLQLFIKLILFMFMPIVLVGSIFWSDESFHRIANKIFKELDH